MDWVVNRRQYEQFAAEINKEIILTTKDHKFWHFLGTCLAILRVMPKNVFLESFSTTIGPIVAIPRNRQDTDSLKLTIVHEGRHVQQFSWFGLCIPVLGPWIGIVGMVIFYGLLLPLGFNWFRYRFELDADRAEWKYMLRAGYTFQSVMNRARQFAKVVGSSKYGWPVPRFWALWGFTREAKKLRSITHD